MPEQPEFSLRRTFVHDQDLRQCDLVEVRVYEYSDADVWEFRCVAVRGIVSQIHDKHHADDPRAITVLQDTPIPANETYQFTAPIRFSEDPFWIVPSEDEKHFLRTVVRKVVSPSIKYGYAKSDS